MSRLPQSDIHVLPQHAHANFAAWLLQENERLAGAHSFSMATELRQTARLLKAMVWAFPTGLLLRWQMRRQVQLRRILQFEPLLAARSNIEKSSFAYDTLLFGEPLYNLLRHKTHLANLVCLAIMFGDEFIDGIANTYGKKDTASLLTNPEYNFQLQYRQGKTNAELYYAFDICEILPPQVLDAVNEKYKITYRQFYSHLLYLLAEMNRQLCRLDADCAEEAAGIICRVCNNCFDTYRADVLCFNPQYTLAELLAYQRSKDDAVVHQLLTLRAVLLGKKQLKYQKHFGSWSSILRSLQLYDDMQDAATDSHYQMNLCCWLAQNYFAAEWQWLLQHRQALSLLPEAEVSALVALHMPGACMLTMQYARYISLGGLSWVQRKMVNHLWRKNWLGLHSKQGVCLATLLHMVQASPPMRLYAIHALVSRCSHPSLNETHCKSWAIDIALMDPTLRRWMLKRLTHTQRYRLLSCFLECSMEEKAAWYNRWVG
jgi:hypothetical protein